AACSPDGIQLVDEDYGRCVLTCRLEQVANASGSHAHDDLHELRAAHGEERNAGLAGDSAREQCLAGARCANEQDALGCSTAEPCVLAGVSQKVHELHELVLRFVDSGHIVERDASILLLIEALCAALRDSSEQPAASEAACLLRAPKQPEIEDEDQDGRAEAEQKRREGVPAL